MNPILLAVIVLGVLGLAGGSLLVLASKFMAVQEDPRIVRVADCLAGANCGGCGYAGCADYAEAIVKDGAKTYLCAPGGPKAAAAINQIMGETGGAGKAKKAFVACSGGESCEKRADYQGVESCAAATGVSGGPLACSVGCLGFGDCMESCRFDAISLAGGKALIDQEACTGCGVCTSVCPRGLISLRETVKAPLLACANKERGAAVSKICKSGCIGCGICVKNCPEKAVTLENNLPVFNPEACKGCGICVEKCPKHVLTFCAANAQN